MIQTPEEIKTKLKQLGIRPDKYLGQHFLTDQSVLDRIVALAHGFLDPDDTIVEAGPGLGVLTEALLSLGENRVITVERDPVFVQSLHQRLAVHDQLKVIQGDILHELEANEDLNNLKKWVFIANIPYAITSPLLRKLTLGRYPPHHILILAQKELAERITAVAGDSRRGFLTVILEIFHETRIINSVNKTSFWPRPEVESALLLLTRRVNPLISPSELKEVLQVVGIGFSAKRKQLHNSLTGGLNLPNTQIKEAMNQIKIDPSRRAETLTIAEWQQLTRFLFHGV